MSQERPKDENAKGKEPLDPRTQRRILRFINAARTPEALAFVPKNEIPPEEPDPVVRHPVFEHELEGLEAITSMANARNVLNARDEASPLIG